MIILSENNAFQNIAKCLKKECSSLEQIEDFLQHCIEIIFCDKIKIAGLVPQSIINDSNEIIESLKNNYSIPNIEFEIIEDNSAKSDEIIQNVAYLLYYQMDTFLEKIKNFTKNEALTYLPKLPQDSIDLLVNTTKAIKEKNKNIFEEYIKISKFSVDSCFFKIVNTNDKIIEKIFAFDDNVGWNEAMSYCIISEIKFLSNRLLAKMNNLIYLPSIKRGRIDNNNRLLINRLLPDKIDSIIKESVSLIGKLNMPSLRDYIVEKSMGRPKEILKIVSDLRDKFRPVREYISDIKKDSTINSMSALNEIANALFDKIRKGSPYNQKTIFENVYTYTIGVGPVGISAPVPDTRTLDRIRKLNTCVESFTEIIDDMLINNNSGFNRELIKNSFT
jgi:hypothetical protein